MKLNGDLKGPCKKIRESWPQEYAYDVFIKVRHRSGADTQSVNILPVGSKFDLGCFSFLPFGHRLQCSTCTGPRAVTCPLQRNLPHTWTYGAAGHPFKACTAWQLYYLFPQGVKSSVAGGTTTQSKGFGDTTQEFAKTFSSPVPGTWGQRTCAWFCLWNLGFKEISMLYQIMTKR